MNKITLKNRNFPALFLLCNKINQTVTNHLKD